MEMPNKEKKDYNIKYPYLPKGRDILYVPKDNNFMQMAKETAFEESTDKRFSTGAVIVRVNDGVVVSRGANNVPFTNRHLINLHKKYCVRKLFKIPSGQKYWVCPGCPGGNHHAEYTASKKLIKQGYDKKDSFDLYLWGHWWACKDCWDKMLEIPIRNLYLMEDSEILFNEKNESNIIANRFNDKK